MVAAVGHRHPADEVGHPGERRALETGVLVQEVVEVPGFVADPEVVVALADQVVEDHEVGDQDLVHPPDRLERVQVVLAGLRLDVAALAGQPRRRRMDPLPRLLQEVGHRRLRQPLDLHPGTLPAQLLGDREVSAYVSEPDRRRQVQHALRSARGALVSLDGLGTGDPRQRVGEHSVERDRLPGRRRVTRALEGDERPAGELGQPDARFVGDDAVVGAVDDDDRAPDVRALLLDAQLTGNASDLGPHQGLAVGATAPVDEVLDQLGRVLLRHELVEEEVEEPRVVAQPGELVVTTPAVVVTGVLAPACEHRLALRRELDQVADGRRDRDPGGDPVRMLGREVQRVQVAHGQPDHHRPLGPRRVEHVERVLRLLGAEVRRPRLRSVGPTVAARVERDHPGAPGQVGDLELPDLGRDDAPGRQEQHGRVVGTPQLAVRLPGDAHAVAFDEAGGIGLACLHGRLLQGGREHAHPGRPGRPGGGPGCHSSDEVRDHTVHGHGVARVGHVTGAAEHEQLCAGVPRHAYAAGDGLADVVGALDDDHRAGDRPQHLFGPRDGVADVLGVAQGDHHLTGGAPGPADHVLVDLAAVRVVADLGEEVARERRPVATPHGLVVDLPPLRVLEVGDPRRGGVDPAVGRRRPVVRAGRDRHDARHAVRVPRRREQGVPRAVAQPDQDRPVDPAGVHHGGQVAHEGQVGVVLAAQRTVAPAVATPVDHHHLVVPCQIGDLPLPHPAVDDRVRRREHDRVGPGPEDLVVHAHALAVDVPGRVRLSCAHGAPPAVVVGPTVPSPGCNPVARPATDAPDQASTS